ncbi:MAG TPA: NUDIX domain-containing protein [Thermoanaerobaculia bacterium]
MKKATQLLEELRRYQPADALEAQHHRAILDLLGYGRSPFSRSEFVPGHITASCFILDPDSGRLLLHHHRRLGRWLQMGGHVEPGESVLEAALREGAEESGLTDLVAMTDEVVDIDVHEIPAAKGEPDHAHFDIRYVAFTTQPSALTLDPNESYKLAWVKLEDAIPMMNEKASLRTIAKIGRLLQEIRCPS